MAGTRGAAPSPAGSNGVTDGATRHQGTWTTRTGTYTITEGIGVESVGAATPGRPSPAGAQASSST